MAGPMAAPASPSAAGLTMADQAQRQERLDAALRRHERLARQLQDSAVAWERRVDPNAGRSPAEIMSAKRRQLAGGAGPEATSSSPSIASPSPIKSRRAREEEDKLRAEVVAERTRQGIEQDVQAAVEHQLQAEMEQRLRAKQKEIEDEMKRYKKELLFMLTSTRDAVQSKHRVEIEAKDAIISSLRKGLAEKDVEILQILAEHDRDLDAREPDQGHLLSGFEGPQYHRLLLAKQAELVRVRADFQRDTEYLERAAARSGGGTQQLADGGSAPRPNSVLPTEFPTFYRCVADGAAVTTELDISRRGASLTIVAKLRDGQMVEVEQAAKASDGRVRVRALDPPGWLSVSTASGRRLLEADVVGGLRAKLALQTIKASKAEDENRSLAAQFQQELAAMVAEQQQQQQQQQPTPEESPQQQQPAEQKLAAGDSPQLTQLQELIQMQQQQMTALSTQVQQLATSPVQRQFAPPSFSTPMQLQQLDAAQALQQQQQQQTAQRLQEVETMLEQQTQEKRRMAAEVDTLRKMQTASPPPPPPTPPAASAAQEPMFVTAQPTPLAVAAVMQQAAPPLASSPVQSAARPAATTTPVLAPRPSPSTAAAVAPPPAAAAAKPTPSRAPALVPDSAPTPKPPAATGKQVIAAAVAKAATQQQPPPFVAAEAEAGDTDEEFDTDRSSSPEPDREWHQPQPLLLHSSSPPQPTLSGGVPPGITGKVYNVITSAGVLQQLSVGEEGLEVYLNQSPHAKHLYTEMKAWNALEGKGFEVVPKIGATVMYTTPKGHDICSEMQEKAQQYAAKLKAAAVVSAPAPAPAPAP
eukprot:SAG22_NODE_1862_length_3419_cov_2.217771_3_plen_811_part_01